MNKTRKTISYAGRGAAWTTEKLVSELALPAAVVSASGNGNYFGNVWQGITGLPEGIYNLTKAYVTNEGFRDFSNNIALKVMSGVGNIAENMGTNPGETVIAAATTFALYKAIPFTTSRLRNQGRRKSLEKIK